MTGCKPGMWSACGFNEVRLAASERDTLIRTGERPPMPALFGVRLAIRRHEAIAGGRLNDNQPAVFLMADPETGLAPPSWLPQIGCGGTGPVTAVSLDGAYSAMDAALVHEFMDQLMDLFGDGIEAVRPRLNARSFQTFIRHRVSRVESGYVATRVLFSLPACPATSNTGQPVKNCVSTRPGSPGTGSRRARARRCASTRRASTWRDRA